MFEFYCKKLEEWVERKSCEDCEKLESCKKDGYLTKVDDELGLDAVSASEPKRLQSLAKKLQRALKTGYLASSKRDIYSLKISGVTDPPKEPFSEKDLQDISKVLGIPVSSDLSVRLTNATLNYLANKEIWKGNPSPNELRNELLNILEPARKLLTRLDKFDSMVTLEEPNNNIHLNTLDTKVYSILKSTYGEIDNIHIDLHRLTNAIKEELENLRSKTGILMNYPLKIYFAELAMIYEDITGEKPTITYDPLTYKSSQFLQFVFACLQHVDQEVM
jgi:hypothetical protein